MPADLSAVALAKAEAYAEVGRKRVGDLARQPTFVNERSTTVGKPKPAEALAKVGEAWPASRSFSE